MEKQRCHGMIVVQRIFNSLSVFIFIIAANIIEIIKNVSEISDNEKTKIDLIAILLFFGAAVIIFAALVGYYIAAWRKAVFWVENDMLIYESGVFTRKRVEMRLDKINTVDTRRGILGIIFGASNLKVDSGSVTTSAKSEFKLVLSTQKALRIREYLLERKNALAQGIYIEDKGLPTDNSFPQSFSALEDTASAVQGSGAAIFKAKLTDFIKLGITGNRLLVLNFVFLVAAFSLYSSLTDDDYFNINKYITDINIYIIIFIILLIFLIVIPIVSVITTFFRYFNFTIFRSGNNIRIDHGLISQKSYTLPIDKIHAVTLKQNPFQRLLKLWSIELSTIGYGGEKDEEAVLYPIAKETTCRKIISSLLPEFTLPEPEISCSKNSLFMFIIKPALFAIILSVPAFLISPYFWFLQFLSLIGLTSALLTKYNTKLGCKASTLFTSTGGLFREVNYIRLSSIQSLNKRAGYFQRKACCMTLTVDYYAQVLRSKVVLRQLPSSIFNNVMSLID